MKYKGYYDENFKHIGFLTEDDERTLSDNYVLFTEEDWMKANTELNGVFKYDATTPQDLTKIQAFTSIIEEPDDIKQAIKEAKLKIEKEKAMETLAKMQVESMALTLPVEKLLEIKILFPEWKDLIGKSITKADYPYILDDGILYNLQQDTVVQEQFSPDMEGMLSIYAPVLINPTNPEPQPWKQPIPPQSYNKGDQVTHKGFVWESGVYDNIWEPGAPGIYDNIWKKIREV